MSDSPYIRPFFYGQAENRLNTKGQVAIPKRFREVVPEQQRQQGFVLVKGEAECIYMYTHLQFAEIKERVRAIAAEEGDSEFFRRFMESAHAVDLDSQGRFVLPAVLRQQVGIGGPAVLFIGMDDRIEIWEPKTRTAARGDVGEYDDRRQVQAKRIFGL